MRQFLRLYKFKEETVIHKILEVSTSKNPMNILNSSEKESEKLESKTNVNMVWKMNLRCLKIS